AHVKQGTARCPRCVHAVDPRSRTSPCGGGFVEQSRCKIMPAVQFQAHAVAVKTGDKSRVVRLEMFAGKAQAARSRLPCGVDVARGEGGEYLFRAALPREIFRPPAGSEKLCVAP